MLIFLDTEFTSLEWAPELLSVGLVTEDPERSLYLERNDFLIENCSQFVVDEVLSLFGRNSHAATNYDGLGRRISRWFKSLGKPIILVCDSRLDIDLVMALLWDYPLHRVDGYVLIDNFVEVPVFANAETTYLAARGLTKHHALHDALALKAGFHALPENIRDAILLCQFVRIGRR
ncbi:MAG: hypothetical protein Q8Q73_05985 [Stagnimonas sp.]|nr:hypothetical protein [Stagnimonas sp.]